MNILYLVHQNILFEDSGTPVVTNQYAQEAIKAGHQVSIISANNDTTPFFYEGVHYVPVEPLEDWSKKAFLKDQNIGKIKINLPFEPDIIHIIDWVNINPRIINFLKTLNKPIIRHFCNFEDICYFHHPFYQHKNLSVCKNKLTSAICSRCIANKTFKDKKVFKKIKSIIFNEKKKDELKYFRLLESRNETVNQQLNKNYDYFIFPSNKFSKYFFSHVNIKKRFDVIPHGIKKNYRILEKNKNISKFNIIFIGGIDKRKGWSIVIKALNKLLKMTNSEISIRIYGDKKKTSKSILSKYKNVEFYVGKDKIHMKPGELWILDTSYKHSVFNGGDHSRAHIVFECRINEEIKKYLFNDYKAKLHTFNFAIWGMLKFSESLLVNIYKDPKYFVKQMRMVFRFIVLKISGKY